MKVAVLLHGCGGYDGTEISETILTFLALEENNIKYQCFAQDKHQHHVIDHFTEKETDEKRNILNESARMTRGNIKDLKDLNFDDFDGLIIPGGFGTAKNITNWAFEGSKGTIDKDIKNVIINFVENNKPIVALCMSPTTVAKALEGTKYSAKLTVGSDRVSSFYDISEISNQVKSLGHTTEMKKITEISYDENLKIITAPCFMLDVSLLEVRNNIKLAIDKLAKLR